MARTATVTLAGRDYEVTELRLRDNAAWRKQLLALGDDLATLLEAPGLEFTPGVMAEIVRRAMRLLAGSPEELLRLLCDYAPEIGADRERIETEAFDSELVAAFGEVLKLAFPFAGLLRNIRGLTNGLGAAPTGQNSRAASGASGTTS